MRARRRPHLGIEQRPLDGQAPERDALARVVLHAAVALGGIGELQEGRGLGRHVEVGHREPDEVAGAEVRRELHRPRPGQVEGSHQLVERRRHPRHLPAVHHDRHRRVGLVGIGVDGDAVAARRRRHEALGRAVERVGRAEVEERREGVVELLDDAEAQGLRVLDARQVPRIHVLDAVLERTGAGAGREGRVQGPVGRLEVGAHVQRRHALVGRHRVEPARVGLGRQGLGQVEADRLVDVQQILDGVGVLEPREPPQRRPRAVAGREVRVDQGPLQRPEGVLDHRRVRPADAAGAASRRSPPARRCAPTRGRWRDRSGRGPGWRCRGGSRSGGRGTSGTTSRRAAPRPPRTTGRRAGRGPREQRCETHRKRSIHHSHLFDDHSAAWRRMPDLRRQPRIMPEPGDPRQPVQRAPGAGLSGVIRNRMPISSIGTATMAASRRHRLRVSVRVAPASRGFR